MKVCIAEKPSVAREIASVLGANTRRDGYLEGNGYQVTWTFGHLCTLKEPEDYSPDLKRWNLMFLPIIPPKYGIKLIKRKGISKQFKTIEQLVKRADEVINCGDAGQEGELIQRWVLAKAKCNKPVKRLWISSLTEEAIREGFSRLRNASDFDSLYAAGSSRAIGDWLLGINATRLYTLRYGMNKQVLSIGRVQTPTLALIVNRQKEIDDFKPETYWELKTKYRDVIFSAEKGKFKEKEKGEEVLQKLTSLPFTVVTFSKKKGKELPPRLFDLTALQVECNKKFNLSADNTLKTVQSLYEKKHVTYPRVDTTYLSNDMYPKIGGIMNALRGYEEFTAPLRGKPYRKSKKVFDDAKVTDHHAIIPTNRPPSTLNRVEQLVYDTIVRRFIANFHPDCIVSKTQVIGEVDNWRFKATGKQILEPGWRVLYQNEKEEDSKKEDNQILPEFTEGESGPHKPELTEKQTRPPKFYSEATLLRAMETAGKQVEDEALREVMKENGIGRPSTRANIIETLFRRKYIQKSGKRIEATLTGMQLIDTIHNDLLKSAELTGQWEQKLSQIEKGNYKVNDFMEEMKQMVSEIVQQVKNDNSVRRIETVQSASKSKKSAKSKSQTTQKAQKPEETLCPKCSKGKILKGKNAYGCSEWKQGCRFMVPFEFAGKKLTEKQVFTLIQKGKTPLIKGFKKGDQKVNGRLHFDQNYQLQLDESTAQNEPKTVTCPKCKSGEIIKGKAAWGCSNWKNGCRLVIPFEVKGKKLTEKQMQDLCLKGRTTKVKGFQGEPAEGRITLDRDFRVVVV